MEPISKEEEDTFIKQNEPFIVCVRTWIEEKTDSFAIRDLDVFTDLIYRYLKKSSAQLHGDLKLMKTRHFN